MTIIFFYIYYNIAISAGGAVVAEWFLRERIGTYDNKFYVKSDGRDTG